MIEKEIETFVKPWDNPGAAVNTDDINLYNYKRQRQQRIEMQRKVEEINKVKQEVQEIKSDISDIKILLLQVLEKNK